MAHLSPVCTRADVFVLGFISGIGNKWFAVLRQMSDVVQALGHYPGQLLTLPRVCLIKYTLQIRMYRNSTVAGVPILFQLINVPN